ncbi:MAG: GFA family protein [Geminicoccaceae bacterium]
MSEPREGGCFCGAARYRVAGPPIDAGYCHCRMCQRSVGAPVVAWGTWPSGSFQWLTEEPATLASSAEGRRQFCARCGTQLLFRATDEPERVDINLATLDDPAGIVPEYHVWTASRIPWFETADALPRYPDAGRDRPGLREGSL